MKDPVHRGDDPRGRRWCWAAILLFAVACVAGPLGTALQRPEGGDDTMAAAIHAAIACGIILCVGLVAAVVGFVRTRQRPVLRWVCLLLYLLPIAGAVLGLLFGMLRG